MQLILTNTADSSSLATSLISRARWRDMYMYRNVKTVFITVKIVKET